MSPLKDSGLYGRHVLNLNMQCNGFALKLAYKNDEKVKVRRFVHYMETMTANIKLFNTKTLKRFDLNIILRDLEKTELQSDSF